MRFINLIITFSLLTFFKLIIFINRSLILIKLNKIKLNRKCK